MQRNNRNTQRRQGRRNSQRQGMNSVYGRVRQYTNALINDTEDNQRMIDNMTLYKGGTAGGGKQTNLVSLRQSGVTHVTDVIANSDIAVAFLAPKDSNDPTHCVSFKLIEGGRKFRGDWLFMQITA